MPSVTESIASALGKQGETLFGRETDSLGTVKVLLAKNRSQRGWQRGAVRRVECGAPMALRICRAEARRYISFSEGTNTEGHDLSDP